MIRRYYKIEFELTEPLSLGSGETKHSDRDLLKNRLGEPFIPGSSLAGIYRTLFGKEEAEKYFGALYDKNKVKDNEEQRLTPSKVIVYDAAVLKGEKFTTSIRDSVGLDEFKTAKDGAKFDFEMVEPGVTFVTYVEQICDSEDELDVGAVIAKAYQEGRIYIGHKTTRGYGGIEVKNICFRKFDLSDATERSKWLDFNLYAEDKKAFTDSDVWAPDKSALQDDSLCQIVLSLKLRDGISIRRYTTEPADEENKSVPDYTQMYYTNKEGEDKEGEEIPCIPGTTWAGAFRHHIKQLLPKDKSQVIIDAYFGHSTGNEKVKSKVRFSESKIQGSTPKVITRNAIDRFTGGTISGALYTEKAFFGGDTELTITFPQKIFTQQDADSNQVCQTGENQVNLWKKVLAAAITDLDQGFLSIGGLTAVGRGLFRVTECCYNGDSIYENERTELKCTEEQPGLYSLLIKAMNDEKQGRGVS